MNLNQGIFRIFEINCTWELFDHFGYPWNRLYLSSLSDSLISLQGFGFKTSNFQLSTRNFFRSTSHRTTSSATYHFLKAEKMASEFGDNGREFRVFSSPSPPFSNLFVLGFIRTNARRNCGNFADVFLRSCPRRKGEPRLWALNY